MEITPLDGIFTARPIGKLQSLAEESASALVDGGFVLVDNKAGRADASEGRTRVRKFEVLAMYEGAPDELSKYVGRKVFCSCMENERDNNVIVDHSNGEKTWFLPVSSILGYDAGDMA